jgi:hypothetical protein
MREPAKGAAKELSEKAKFRLKVFDWYRNTPPRFSLSGLPDAKLACRHFGIHRSSSPSSRNAKGRWKKPPPVSAKPLQLSMTTAAKT